MRPRVAGRSITVRRWPPAAVDPAPAPGLRRPFPAAPSCLRHSLPPWMWTGLGFGQVALERERVAGRPAGLVVALGEAGPGGGGGSRRPRGGHVSAART